MNRYDTKDDTKNAIVIIFIISSIFGFIAYLFGGVNVDKLYGPTTKDGIHFFQTRRMGL